MITKTYYNEILYYRYLRIIIIYIFNLTYNGDSLIDDPPNLFLYLEEGNTSTQHDTIAINIKFNYGTILKK